MDNPLRMGTCSWKYDSWQGIVYPESKGFNYLEEYAKHFNSVEVDQWFWSLFGIDKVKLPEPGVVEEYIQSAPPGFKFAIKIPNSITLTHFYSHGKPKDAPLESNPHFFSTDLFRRFLDLVEPFGEKIGALMFQFEYLNKQKMVSQKVFLEKFEAFIQASSSHFPYAVEIRNPNYLNEPYFKFLNKNKLGHVFVQGYYMPPIWDIYKKYREYVQDMTVIRLMGSDRSGIEDRAGNKWNTIIDPRDNELPNIVEMIKDLEQKGVLVFVNVNNHYEGSAPLTIRKIKEMMKRN